MKCAHCGRLSAKAPCRATARCIAWQRAHAQFEALVFVPRQTVYSSAARKFVVPWFKEA